MVISTLAAVGSALTVAVIHADDLLNIVLDLATEAYDMFHIDGAADIFEHVAENFNFIEAFDNKAEAIETISEIKINFIARPE
jgi:hypothetical protein